jgi:hypothetical protein
MKLGFITGIMLTLGVMLLLREFRQSQQPQNVIVMQPTPVPAPVLAQTPAPTDAQVTALNATIIPTPPPIAAATPAPTPNPAHGAIQAVIEMYPDVARQGSTFNMMFLDFVQEAKKTDPNSLEGPEWPFTIANEVAAKLGVAVATPPPMVIPSTSPTIPPLDVDNPLAKGAYDKSVSRGWYYNEYGRRVYYYSN